MPRFTRAELESYRNAEVPDLAGPGMRLLFVGINPGLMTAALGIHFGNPGNRFRPALVGAGLLAPLNGAPPGMTEADLAALVARGVGITNLVRRATARADELTKEELVRGSVRGSRRSSPTTGRGSSPSSASRRTAAPSPCRGPRSAGSPSRLSGAELWVVPNPSGLNAHETIGSLAVAYAEPARAAGVVGVGAG